MENYSVDDLKKAIISITSMINRSEKVKDKFQEGTSQSTLVKNRVNALNISISLIKKELKEDILLDIKTDDLKKAMLPITSTINKCEKAILKFKDGSSQLTLTKSMLMALYISSSLISKELKAREV